MSRVLVVDDQKTIVETCRLYLEHAGFDVVVGYTGEQALTEARAAKPDLIVLDLMLPRVDGRDVCRRLRDEGVLVPIVMLTALATEEDRIAGLELGADDYVVKPFSPRELVARVRAILRRAPPAEAGEVLRELRSRGVRTPVLVLSAKGMERDKVLGLDLGADDYVVKPFSPVELRARVRRLLRRN